MDVLKPRIINIEGRCYRLNPVQSQRPAEWVEPDEDVEGCDYNEYQTEEGCDLLDLKQTDKGYTLTMEIPSSFFGYIIGKRGETKKRIEQETNTRILIPNKGQKEDEIVIRGEQRSGIVSAKTRIDVIVSSARQKTQFTHFLTMPFNSQDTQERFKEFKEDVLRGSKGDEGLDERLFQKPAKLHLTIGTMVLLSTKEVARAQELLEKCKEEIIRPIMKESFLLVKLKDLEYMNDDPGKVDVLYAKAALKDGSDKLQLICDSLTDRFMEAGLMQQEYDKVKIHITLINTLFRRGQDADDGLKKGRKDGRAEKVREAFDARRILEDFGNYSFGDCLINSIQISQIGSYGADGFYLPAGSVTLP